MEGVNSVVLTLVASVVVDTAAGDDRYICAVRNKEIIVYHVVQTGFRKDHRDMDLFTVCRAVNQNVNAGTVRFLDNLNMFAVTVTKRCTIKAQIEGSCLGKAECIDLFKHLFCGQIKLHGGSPPLRGGHRSSPPADSARQESAAEFRLVCQSFAPFLQQSPKYDRPSEESAPDER